MDEGDLAKLEDSASESEGEDYLWVTRRRPCRLSRLESGDPLTLHLHRGKTSLHAQTASRSRSAPPSSLPSKPHLQSLLIRKGDTSFAKAMLSTATTVDLTFDDDDWTAPPAAAKLYRAASVGNSWGVTSIGRGFDWKALDEQKENSKWDHEPRIHLESHSGNHPQTSQLPKTRSAWVSAPTIPKALGSPPIITTLSTVAPAPIPSYASGSFISRSPVQSRCSSPRPLSPANSFVSGRSPLLRSPSSPRIPGTPRSRRRSSQQRVSLIAGRVSIIPAEPPSPPPIGPQKLVRSGSAASFLSVASSAGPPTPGVDKAPTVGERSISEFVIEREIGRGAYGLVKRAREMQDDGSLGVRGSIRSYFWIRRS